jgi:hypothetical protein
MNAARLANGDKDLKMRRLVKVLGVPRRAVRFRNEVRGADFPGRIVR